MKKILIITAILISINNVTAEDLPPTLNEFSCTEAEVKSMIDNRKESFNNAVFNSNLQLNFEEFEKVNTYTKIEEIKQSGDSDEICKLGTEEVVELYNKAKDTVIDTMDTIKSSYQAIAAFMAGDPAAATGNMISQAWSFVGEFMNEKVCSAASDFIYEDLVPTVKKEARQAAENRLRDSVLSGFVSDRLFDNWMNDQIDEKFNDKYDLLRWRNGTSGGIENRVQDERNDQIDDRIDDFVDKL